LITAANKLFLVKTTSLPFRRLRVFFKLFVVTAAVATARGQIYVSNYGGGVVGEYNATTGATINAGLIHMGGPVGIVAAGSQLYVASYGGTIGEYNLDGSAVNANLVTGLSSIIGLTYANGNLYAASAGGGTVGEYNATTGVAVNATLVSGLSGPEGLAVVGSNLFVVNVNSSTVGEYDANTGATINATFIPATGLSGAINIAYASGNLYVADQNTGNISEFDATTGAVVHNPLISGLADYGIATSGTELLVANRGTNTVGLYNLDGSTVNASFITGLSDAVGVTVATPVPEPSTWAVLSGAAALLAAFYRRQRKTA
jgi:hypothetical protein